MKVHHFTSSDGVRLAYEEFGEGNGGTPLVFCHGIAVNGVQFHEDAKWFAARGHRVLVPHLRGHGLSDSPVPVSRRTLTIERLAIDQFALVTLERVILAEHINTILKITLFRAFLKVGQVIVERQDANRRGRRVFEHRGQELANAQPSKCP